MINKSELRIGNYTSDIHTPTGMWKIKSIGECIVKYGNYAANTYKSRYEHLLPIPLSPEILEKAGIERTGNLASTAARKFYRIGRIIFESIPDNRVAVYIDSETESILIGYKDYLHQLQNLVFDISGQELTINLK